MLKLYLLRHAKSSWADTTGDFERPLAERGRRAAPAMADMMRERGYVPELILVSPAKRTRETVEMVQPRLGPDIPIELDRRLYLASAGVILERLRQVRDDVASVMIVGHNPGLERLARELAATGDQANLARLRRKYPTAALAVIEFAVSQWRRLKPGNGRLTAFVTPRDLHLEDD